MFVLPTFPFFSPFAIFLLPYSEVCDLWVTHRALTAVYARLYASALLSLRERFGFFCRRRPFVGILSPRVFSCTLSLSRPRHSSRRSHMNAYATGVSTLNFFRLCQSTLIIDDLCFLPNTKSSPNGDQSLGMKVEVDSRIT